MGPSCPSRHCNSCLVENPRTKKKIPEKELGVVVQGLIPALGKQKQVDLYELKASLATYVVSKGYIKFQKKPKFE